MDVEVTIQTDTYPEEAAWTLSNECGSGRTMSGGPHSQTNTLYSVRECLPAGKYRFTITDSEGDGLCCGYGTGWYNIVVNGVTTYAGGLFGVSETKTFGECVSITTKPTLYMFSGFCSHTSIHSFIRPHRHLHRSLRPVHP